MTIIAFPLITLILSILMSTTRSQITGYTEINYCKGSYLVLGVTGSGKSTFIKYVNKPTYEGVENIGAGSGYSSMTKELDRYYNRYKIDNVEFDLEFLDTIGFDADDFNSDKLITSLITYLHENRIMLHGVVVVFKMERNRVNVLNQLRFIMKFLQSSSMPSSSVQVIITHSAQYNDASKKLFSKDIKKALDSILGNVRIHHINFALLDELSPVFLEYFKSTMEAETKKSLKLLCSFTKPFNPVASLDNQQKIQENIQKKLRDIKGEYNGQKRKQNDWFSWWHDDL